MNAIRLADVMDRYQIDLPLVASFHGSDVNSNPSKIPGYRDKLLALRDRPTTTFITPSNFLRTTLIEKHHFKPERCIVIPNAFNEVFRHAVTKLKKHHRPRIICPAV